MPTKNLVYDLNDRPKFSKLIIYSFQMLLAILAATIAVPTIIGLPAQIPAAILGAGVGTLVYVLFTKGKSPVMLSSSFAFLSAFPAAIAFGYMGIVLGGLFAGTVYVIIALVIKFVGTRWLDKLLPPVIIGPVVALIGLSLATAAMGDIVKASGSGQTYNLLGLLCGLVAFFVIVIISNQQKKPGLKLIPFVIGIAAGYALASIFTAFGNAFNVDYLKIINWDPLVQNFKNVSITSFFDYPRLSFVEGLKELISGQPSNAIIIAHAQNLANNSKTAALFADFLAKGGQFTEAFITDIRAILDTSHNMPQIVNGVGVAQVALAFIPIAFVTLAEHIADHKNISRIVNKDLLKDPGLHRTLLGDGFGSIAGTSLGICPNTTYGESVACVALTRNASVITTITTAIMCIFLAFLTPFNKLLATIPSCVMGGVCLTLYGFIAVSGLRMFKDIDLDNNVNLMTVSSILIAGIGGLVIAIPYGKDSDGTLLTINITAIATALILGICTYQIASKISKRGTSKVKELNVEVKEEDNFRAYLKTLNIDKLANALLVFGFMHENVDFTCAQLSNLMRSERMLETCSEKELRNIITIFEFDKNPNKLKKAACIKTITTNVRRLDETHHKQITAQEIR